MTEIPTYEQALEKMQETYLELTGIEADSASDIGIRMRVLAGQIARMGESVKALRAEVFPQTSSGSSLELHAQTRGLVRKSAIPAQGMLRFSRETPSQNDIILPSGIVCTTRTDPQVRFETTAEVLIPAGELSAEVPARAIDIGRQGNVAAGSIRMMITPAGGVSSVENPAPFSGGVDEESDDALRARLLESYRSISNGANSAFYYDVAMRSKGVRSARILPRERGRGTVDVVVACVSEPEETVAELQAELSEQKEINVDVLCRTAEENPVNLTVKVDVAQGYDGDIVIERCMTALHGCLDGLGVGESLLLAHLGGKLMGVDGVVNYRILTPLADVVPQRDHIITPGSIGVTRMAVE